MKVEMKRNAIFSLTAVGGYLLGSAIITGFHWYDLIVMCSVDIAVIIARKAIYGADT